MTSQALPGPDTASSVRDVDGTHKQHQFSYVNVDGDGVLTWQTPEGTENRILDDNVITIVAGCPILDPELVPTLEIVDTRAIEIMQQAKTKMIVVDEAFRSTEVSDAEYTIFSLVSIGEDALKKGLFRLQATKATTLPQAFLDQHLFRGLPSHLVADGGIWVLISTLSGTGLATGFYDNILVPLLYAIGVTFNDVRTETYDSVKLFSQASLLPRANMGKNQTMLLLSGDGGIADTLNGLMTSDTEMNYAIPKIALLPLGTGNALFHSMHKRSRLPSLYIQGLRTLIYGTPKRLPVFCARFSPGARILLDEGRVERPIIGNCLYGAVVASYGFHSTLVADSDTPEYRKHGDKRFGMVAKELLYPGEGQMPHAYKANVTVMQGSTPERGKTACTPTKVYGPEHGYVLASMVSNLEKRFTISPKSEPLDGSLRLVRFKPLSATKTLQIMDGAYKDGEHIDNNDVTYLEIGALNIDFNEGGESWKWRRCCIDGVIVGVEKGGSVSIDTVFEGMHAVDIVAPPGV